MQQKQIERRSFLVSAAVNLIITLAGFQVWHSTGIQALFLDFAFSLIILFSTLAAAVISHISARRTPAYPNGLYMLEPLYAVLKSLLTLLLLLGTLAKTARTAWDWFAHGVGAPLFTAPVLPYTLCMVALCFGLGFFNDRQNRSLHGTSPMLAAESQSNFLDGLQSLGVGLAIVGLMRIDIAGPLGFLHYTGDFFITLLLVCISIHEPLRVLRASFRELSGAATLQSDILDAVGQAIARRLPAVRRWEVYKVGTHLTVRIPLPPETDPAERAALLRARDAVARELSATYESITVYFTL